MTGISPTCVSARSAVGSTASTSPTKPRSRPPGSRRGLAVTSSPSSPDRPTAMRPCRLSRPTRVLLMRPTSTMRTRSMVSASVTRWPSTNTGRLPSCSIARLISGPPQRHVVDEGVEVGGARGGLVVVTVAGRGRRGHGGAAVLDDHGVAGEALDPRQRLVQHGRLGLQLLRRLAQGADPRPRFLGPAHVVCSVHFVDSATCDFVTSYTPS